MLICSGITKIFMCSFTRLHKRLITTSAQYKYSVTRQYKNIVTIYSTFRVILLCNCAL